MCGGGLKGSGRFWQYQGTSRVCKQLGEAKWGLLGFGEDQGTSGICRGASGSRRVWCD